MASAASCHTPVLFLIQRRLEESRRVMEALRLARPAVLLVAADGPAEDPRCEEVRKAVMNGIDWPCKVSTRFLDERQGCRTAVSSALDWAFSLHEQLIILEDDCLPHPDFFAFCEAMLHRFMETPEVMQVCGSNLTSLRPADQSYYFSRFGPIWGWASWRRAWQAYDVEMNSWDRMRHSGRLGQLCPEPFEAGWRREVLDSVHQRQVDTWDYQWAYAKLCCGGLNIVPAVNLVSNIGFGPDATHTLNAADPRAALATHGLTFPLQHAGSITPWQQADRAYLHHVVGLPPKTWSIRGIRRILRSLFKR